MDKYILVSAMLFILFLGMGTKAVAQSTGKISGTIVDASTGESLPGVTIYLEENTSIGTVSNEDGRYFMLSVPPGKYTVVMSFVGFSTLKNANVEVFSGRTTTSQGVVFMPGSGCSQEWLLCLLSRRLIG